MFNGLRIVAPIACAISILASDFGVSAPAFYPPWPSVSLDNPRTLSYLRDSQDERLIWVKPPRMGFVGSGEGSVSLHPNQTRCPVLAKNLSDLFAQTGQFKHALKEISDYTRQELDAHAAVRRVRHEVEKYLDAADDSALDIFSAATMLHRSKFELVDVTHRVDACRKTCDDLYWQKFHIETAIDKAKAELSEWEGKQPKMAKELGSLVAKQWQHRHTAYDIARTRRTTQKHLFKKERRLFKSYASRAILSGGTKRVSYRLRWAEAIADLAKRNPKYTFKAIPVRSLRLRARHIPTKINDFYLSTLPTFLGFEGTSHILKNYGHIDVGGDFSAKAVDHLDANFIFSLNGACPIVSDEFREVLAGRVIKDANTQAVYSATLTYSYQVELPKATKARFNPVAVYEAIKRPASGFLSRGDAQQLLDNGQLDKAIELPAGLDRPVAIALKQEALNRVLAAMATTLGDVPSSSAEFAPVDAEISGMRQAQVYSRKVAGWDLLTGEAHETAIKTLKRTQSGWQPLTFSEGRMVTLTDIALFSGEIAGKGGRR